MFWLEEVLAKTVPNDRDVDPQCGTAVCVVQVTVVEAGATFAPVGANDWLIEIPGTLVAAVTTTLQLAPAATPEQLLLVTLSGAARLGMASVIGKLPSLR